jgi:putative ABC transport system ATP-binding protein
MATGDAPFLRLDHLSRRVSGRTILDDITLEVAQGETLVIVGPSGSGKSSLLRLINRLDEPTAGTVFLEGRDYRQIPPRALRRKVGMMMQHAYLFPGTVADNVRFGPRQRGEQLSDDEVSALLHQVGLEGYSERDTAPLSGGEAQRVSLARCLANSPSALLLDEPTSALNEELRLQVEALLIDVVSRNGLTCLFVTHETAQAVRIGRRMAVIERGRLKAVGLPKEVLNAQRTD